MPESPHDSIDTEQAPDRTKTRTTTKSDPTGRDRNNNNYEAGKEDAGGHFLYTTTQQTVDSVLVSTPKGVPRAPTSKGVPRGVYTCASTSKGDRTNDTKPTKLLPHHKSIPIMTRLPSNNMSLNGILRHSDIP
eukprot:CAMPEP_0201239842 /NCGR_PEP_ID=MMETSP0852-20130820/26876_1 /ASSEMBLY_ACC=CAM_ASM_000632 /TAXON_ID=183588 /ORGANISM="Pseudo-nitzschia fraudulenta, Strain WWA7" /LENGTH=132 /DNA_ID=CAMNT_0047535417 /DNA_START=453 /DNA_END=848 /DNA_ORIENTATION=-